MGSNLPSDFPARATGDDPDAYRVSVEPVIPGRTGAPRAQADDELDPPRSYGLETLWLMPRDPHSLFAFWDIDWQIAFGEETPRARTVQLRLLKEDGSEHLIMAVEPMAGHCTLQVEKADTAYRAEIGYRDDAGDWQSVSVSEAISVPPEQGGAALPGAFATIPLHLSFQRRLDAARSQPAENQSLTETLSALRQRVAASTEKAQFTAQQTEIVREIEEAAALQPPPAESAASAPDLWEHDRLERIFGFGNSSLSEGFGGSSRR